VFKYQQPRGARPASRQGNKFWRGNLPDPCNNQPTTAISYLVAKILGGHSPLQMLYKMGSRQWMACDGGAEGLVMTKTWGEGHAEPHLQLCYRWGQGLDALEMGSRRWMGSGGIDAEGCSIDYTVRGGCSVDWWML
jgi:hypothetical protein